ncbi:MAG TPA: ATP-dependent DNA helicase [Acidimicrobiales bacterium]|nr:ATP-dependent DNA helicase [Acidimicrobiales bacterium]
MESPDAALEALARVTDALPGGEVRTQQLDMCRGVAQAVASGRSLVVQAGTGTGKSLAYLVPAAVSGAKVVVSTATKALQDQLDTKDLPLVAAALGDGFTWSVLKGRSNYLCRQRAAEMTGRGVTEQLAMPDAEEAGEVATASSAGPGGDGLVDQVRRLLAWADETETGDRAELAFEPSPRAWSMLSVGPRECPGAFRCPSGGTCFAEAARTEAAAADIVVVNTHLYGAHLASGGAVLPEHDVVVFDEAHEVEEVMTASLGVELAPGRFRALAAAARPFAREDRDKETLDALGEVGERLGAELADRVGTRVLDRTGSAPGRPGPHPVDPGGEPSGRARVRTAPEPVAPPPAAEPADRRLEDLVNVASMRLEQLMALLRAAHGADDAAAGRLARALSAAGNLMTDVARVAGRTDDDVAWVDGTARAPVLRLSPIDVGPALAEALWPEVTAVLTSATIPPGLTERLGLDAARFDRLDVGSPFDYAGHSLLYVAKHLPDRRRPEAEPALHDELAALITAAGGRTLALFTSRRATEAAVGALRPRLPFTLYAQGDRPKGRLLEAFADDEASCLFATLGFWQGVDVPGRSLSMVTLDRLPFARPDDPLLEARRARAGDAAFRLVDIPRAATLLAQGAGRLIRSASDRGVVAILDPRLATAGYRRVLLAAMPPMRRTIDRRQVEDFLARILSDDGPDGDAVSTPARRAGRPDAASGARR